MSDIVKIAVIGVGNMGSAHLGSIHKIENLELVALCDTNPEKKALAEEHKCAFYDNHKELLAAQICDAVLIATPHYDHTIIGIDALNAGLHILVEKPISVHKADCERLIAAHTNPKQVFAAMFNQRTNEAYIKAKKIMDNGELGTFRRVNWIITNWYRTQSYYNSGGWRATWKGEGGGVLLNQCPHQLDLIQWLCGMPKKVVTLGAVGQFHDIEVEDNITTMMEYENGATGVFVTTTGEAPGTNRLEIVGTQGKIVIENDKMTFTRNEVPTDVHLKTEPGGFTTPGVWNIDIPYESKASFQHKTILENFADHIQGKAELIAPAAEGINSVELANAMIYSGLNKVPVELPLDKDQYETYLMGLIENSTFVKAESKNSTSDFSKSF